MGTEWRFCGWTKTSITGAPMSCGKRAVATGRVDPTIVTDPDGTVRHLSGYEFGLCEEHAAKFTPGRDARDTPAR